MDKTVITKALVFDGSSLHRGPRHCHVHLDDDIEKVSRLLFQLAKAGVTTALDMGHFTGPVQDSLRSSSVMADAASPGPSQPAQSWLMCLVRVRKSRAAVAVTEATGTVSACFQKRIDWQNPGVAEDTNPVWLRPSPPLLPYEAPWAQSPNNDIRYTKNAWKQDAAVIARLYDEIQRNGFPHLQTHLTDADFREARGILRGMDAGRRQVANDRALEIIHSQKSLMSQKYQRRYPLPMALTASNVPGHPTRDHLHHTAPNLDLLDPRTEINLAMAESITTEITLATALIDTLETDRDAIIEARKRGMLTVAHAARNGALEMAQEGKVDIVTHVPLDIPLEDAATKLMKEEGRVCVPTLVMEGTMANGKVFPGLKYSAAKESVTRIHKAALHRELELLVDARLSNEEALRAATSLTAEWFRLSDRGAITVGKRADMVLVGGNPADDIAGTKNVKRVWIGREEVPLG
ncbi:uncharacterized protein K444DRAFT_666824 [Hyaloscypha bicolor E]|uniref:Amidohydrolase-related domain-containing protein n=1 Tax=Hyaloscypha bicolor E TaxID=1095630 RepID=A0A2J6SVQ4_9HELO|nr:uncharacterized protein K444DRAFT_666824 [Hyaloscypha bicolor E]PMD54858.1 hypothetical protein K444DRAFT_666824 [Hyaloscypha bicolor E]